MSCEGGKDPSPVLSGCVPVNQELDKIPSKSFLLLTAEAVGVDENSDYLKICQGKAFFSFSLVGQRGAGYSSVTARSGSCAQGLCKWNILIPVGFQG